MRRDRKAAQKKKAREVARRSQSAAPHPAALLRLARTSDFGPAFLSPEWREERAPPELVSVIVTRTLPRGRFAAHSMLVDRTCLGVKSAFSAAPLSDDELRDLVESVGAAHGGEMETVRPAVAQSIVLHALDHASRLGFAPDRDFDAALLEPRPAVLEETPLARPARPFYLPGPEDDRARVIAKLEAAVGTAGFDLGVPDFDEREP